MNFNCVVSLNPFFMSYLKWRSLRRYLYLLAAADMQLLELAGEGRPEEERDADAERPEPEEPEPGLGVVRRESYILNQIQSGRHQQQQHLFQ